MAKEIMEGVTPTRMELLQIRKRKALAVKGHQLLSEKRDALVSSFFDLIKKRKKAREDMERVMEEAYRAMMMAEMAMGEERVRDMAEKIAMERKVEVKGKNIMGINIPEFHLEEGEMPEYSMLSTTALMDEAVSKAMKMLDRVVEVASIEGSVQMLGREIEKTKRRVNALEYIFIPRLLNTLTYIERQLEEREREDFFRRKRIKALLEQHED
ncbi:MAG TPA: V-type ATP synthase subunit D [Thermoplasmatales archaeon]|nr:V-type ATP synthase subunit D [Thermoplasmatales archaeon]